MDVIGGIIYYCDRSLSQLPGKVSGALHVIKRDSITVFMSDALMKDKSTHLNIEENSIAGGKWRMDRSPALLNKQMNAQDFLDVWQKNGDEGINDFYGDFIFFYFDIKTKSLSLCRDQIGVIPLYFYRSPDYMVFSNSLKAVKDIVGEQYLDEDKFWWPTHFLSYQTDLSGTYYEQIRMIAPGEIGLFTPVHQELRSYYSLKNKPKHLYTKESDYYERFHELLSRAVINRMDSNGPTGVELSGGLDSSSIAAIASKHQNIYSFSNVFSPEDKEIYGQRLHDESQHINKVVDFLVLKNHHSVYARGRGFLDSLKRAKDLYGAPLHDSYVVFSDVLLEMAQENGVNVVLSGIGGDQMVSAGYRNVFLDWFVKGQWSHLKKEIALYFKFQNQKKRVPFIGGILLKGLFPYSVWSRFSSMAKSLNWDHIPLEPGFKDSLPDAMDSSIHHKSYEGLLMERFFHLLIFRRVEELAAVTPAYGIEYRYPLLDRELIEFYLQVPLELKVRNGWGRNLIRHAMDGLLPHDIQWRKDKSGLLNPSFLSRYDQEEEQIFNLFKSIKNHSCFDREALINHFHEASASHKSKAMVMKALLYLAGSERD